MIHPNQLYVGLIGFGSDLALYKSKQSCFLNNYSYQHNQLDKVFNPIFDSLFKRLEQILRTRAIKTVLILKENNLWISEKTIPSLNSLKTLILSAHSLSDLKTVEKTILQEMKITSANKIYDLICHALPGIAIKVLKKLPVDLTYNDNTIYFSLEIENKNDSMAESMACYFNTPIKDLELALWHIKK